MQKKKKSKSKERPVPEVQERIITAESDKSMGERKSIKCEKCNHVINFETELTVDKKGGMKASCIPCMFSFKNQINNLNIEKNQVAMWLLKLMNLLRNASFNRDIR